MKFERTIHNRKNLPSLFRRYFYRESDKNNGGICQLCPSAFTMHALHNSFEVFLSASE